MLFTVDQLPRNHLVISFSKLQTVKQMLNTICEKADKFSHLARHSGMDTAVFLILFQVSWQLSKFINLKYMLCYYIHFLYTLSNIWLICKSEYVCHSADSCFWRCWGDFWGTNNIPIMTDWRCRTKVSIVFLQEIRSENQILSLLQNAGTYHRNSSYELDKKGLGS